MTKAKDGPPEDKIALFDRLVAASPTVERKGDTVPYTSLNGHMFCYLTKAGRLALRLPAAERATFLETYQTRLVEAYGLVQREYVEVPDALLGDTHALTPYFKLSYAYVAGMKPKPTKKS